MKTLYRSIYSNKPETPSQLYGQVDLQLPREPLKRNKMGIKKKKRIENKKRKEKLIKKEKGPLFTNSPSEKFV